MVYADRATWDRAISEDENGSGGVDVLLDLSCNTLLVLLVLLRAAGQPRCVEDANLEKALRVLIAFT